MRKGKKGFTLVELIIVIVIIGILAAVLIPTLTGYIKKTNDQKAAAEAVAAYGEYTNNCNSLGKKPGEIFVYKAGNGDYYEVVEGPQAVKVSSEKAAEDGGVTNIQTCEGGIEYNPGDDVDGNNHNGDDNGGNQGTDGKITYKDIGGVYYFNTIGSTDADFGTTKKSKGQFSLKSGKVYSLFTDAINEDQNNLVGSVSSPQNKTFLYDIQNEKEDDLTMEINTSAGQNQIKYFSPNGTSSVDYNSIQMGERIVDCIHKATIETKEYYNEVYYVRLELAAIEDELTITVEVEEEENKSQILGEPQILTPSERFETVLFASNEPLKGKIKITIETDIKQASPIYIKSYCMSSIKYSTGTKVDITEEITKEYIQKIDNAQQAAKDQPCEVIGTVTFVDVDAITGSGNLFYVQTGTSAMAVFSTSVKPSVGNYVKVTGVKEAGSLKNYSNIFTGAQDVNCSDIEIIDVTDGPKVIPLDISKISEDQFKFISSGVDGAGKNIVIDGETTKIRNYQLVEGDNFTFVSYDKVQDFLAVTGFFYHWEVTATNEAGQTIKFFMHKNAITNKQKEMFANMRAGQKFNVKGGVVFSYDSKNMTYVKLSYQRSEITFLG